MTLLRRSITIMVMLTVVAVVAFSAGFQLNEHGARSMAQGGAFAARAFDGSAIYFNPAGLAFQKGTSFYLGTTLIATAGKYISNGGITTEQDAGTFWPSNAYVTHTFDNGLALGVGFFNPYGLGTTWPMDWAGRRLAVDTQLKTYFINPTVSYRFSDQFALGVGVSYVWSDVSLNYRVPTYSSLAPPTPSGTDGTADLSGKGHAINWNAGLSYKPMPSLYIGVSYRHTTKVDYDDGTVKFANMQALQGFFPGGWGKTSITMPNNIFAGIAYDFTPDLTVEADYQWTGWSSYDTLKVDLQNGPLSPLGVLQKSPSASAKGWKNAWMARVGGEYRLNPLAIRAGFIYDTTPQPMEKVEPMLPDANRVEFTVGVGFNFTPFLGIDFAYQMILFQDRTVTPENHFNGSYDSSANLFGLNLSYSLQ